MCVRARARACVCVCEIKIIAGVVTSAVSDAEEDDLSIIVSEAVPDVHARHDSDRDVDGKLAADVPRHTRRA